MCMYFSYQAGVSPEGGLEGVCLNVAGRDSRVEVAGAGAGAGAGKGRGKHKSPNLILNYQ